MCSDALGCVQMRSDAFGYFEHFRYITNALKGVYMTVAMAVGTAIVMAVVVAVATPALTLLDHVEGVTFLTLSDDLTSSLVVLRLEGRCDLTTYIQIYMAVSILFVCKAWDKNNTTETFPDGRTSKKIKKTQMPLFEELDGYGSCAS